MLRYLKSPNLPDSDVGLVAVSDTYPDIIRALQNMGIEVIPVHPNRYLDEPVDTHADMRCFPFGGNEIIVDRKDENLSHDLKAYGFDVIQSENTIRSPYPHDVGLNAACFRENIIANPKALDQAILIRCCKNRIKLISVNQGYAKCSTAIIDEKSFITADNQIAEAGLSNGYDVLKIHPGSIELKGYPYGFIGGSCGLLGKNKIAFTGNLQSHPDCGSILNFLNRKNMKIINLSNDPLIDIGGIIPLMEKSSFKA